MERNYETVASIVGDLYIKLTLLQDECNKKDELIKELDNKVRVLSTGIMQAQDLRDKDG